MKHHSEGKGRGAGGWGVSGFQAFRLSGFQGFRVSHLSKTRRIRTYVRTKQISWRSRYMMFSSLWFMLVVDASFLPFARKFIDGQVRKVEMRILVEKGYKQIQLTK